MPDPVLSVADVSKRFGPVRALDGISFDLFPGEVHGLIGENGAGKSTLMKVLAGVERPDVGTVRVRGGPIVFRSTADAQAAGVEMIHQELNLVDELTVAENVFLGREVVGRFGLIDGKATVATATRLLRDVGCDVDPRAKVAALSIAQKQMVEIAKAVSQKAAVLIMDEPTAVLSGQEVSTLFALVNRLKAEGAAVVYISHLLPEVLTICDRVTVMRDGKVVGTLDKAEMTAAGERGLASRMVGRAMENHFPPRLPPGEGTAIEVRGLTVPGKVTDVSFAVNHGEILGFAGLVGAGRTETAEAVCGLRAKSAGTVLLDGKEVDLRTVRDAADAGLAYLSEDRKGTGLNLAMSITANTTLASLDRHATPLLSTASERAAAQKRVAELRTKVGHVGDPVSSLSGGNQQKVALAKWLEVAPKVLVIDEPTRGVDIGAKEQIYQLIQGLTRQGMACILISSELNEVIGLSHRVAVMRAGRLVATLPAAEATEEAIMHHAAGVTTVASVTSPAVD